MRQPVPSPPTRPLFVSARADLVSAVLDRLPVPARPDVARDASAARQHFGAASRVLVDADLLSPLAAAAPTRRSEVALLLEAGAPEPDPRACISLGIEQVLDVAEAAAWLGGADRSSGHVVTVTGARGGCGVSTLAVAMASRAAAAGADALLVDLDLLGGGLDLLLGAEESPGVRWSDLRADAPVQTMLADLPALGNLRLLSAGRAPVELAPDLVRRVLRQAGESFDLVVVDLPRSAPPDLLPDPGTVLLVVPDEIRAGAAAAVRLAGFGPGTDVRIVVRESVSGEPALETADRLGCPLAGRLRKENRLAEEAECGLVRSSRSRSPLWRLADRLVADLWAAR